MDKPKKSESSEHLVPFWRQNWADLDRVFDNFRREFERSVSSFPALNLPAMPMASMSCDVLDEGDRYVIHAEMPGVEKKDVKLNASDSGVEISAEHKEESEEKKKDYLRKERKAVSYYRRLPLPEKVDSSKAQAKLNNGILTVDIPKVTPTPKSQSKDIPVQ
ncbi:MAG: Hsp20/alpha crystallin family protein [Thaumarchaeota archaeon]|nr:Hsp20/alpha crystallin family protein [Nitrososphaerota archaeon]